MNAHYVSEYLPRIADGLLSEKLLSAGAVVVRGPKWCGKTETALHQAKSVVYMQDPDRRDSYRQIAQEKPSLLLRGESPRLIDEWQEAPQLWDAVRFSVDREGMRGLYIMTGSSAPAVKGAHSGTGRMAFLEMRPMSLFESRESTGEVSLGKLFDAPSDIEGEARGDIETMAQAIARGGWPGAVIAGNVDAALEMTFDYLRAVAEEDVPRVDGARRNPLHAQTVMRTYARCVATQAGVAGMAKGIKGQGGEMTRPTFNAYVAALRSLYVLDDLPSWHPLLRAKTRITETPKRYFADPSLACAALGASPDLLLRDMPTYGALFENLCVRDIRVYASALKGEVFFYRDDSGSEADAVVVLRDGRWGLVEVKAGRSQVEEAAASLRAVSDKIDKTAMGQPSFLLAVVASGYAYRRADGIYVCPIGCLRP